MTHSRDITTRMGIDFFRDQKIGYNDGDILIINSLNDLGAFQEAGTFSMEMILVMICREGKLRADHDGKPLVLKKKDMLICPPGVTFANMTGSPDFDAVIIGLSYEKFQKTICSGLDIWTLILYASRHPVFHLLDIDMDLTNGYLMVVRNKLQTSREFYYKEILDALMEAVFYEICVVISREIKPGMVETSQAEVLFKRFIVEIGKHGGKERTVAFYAQSLCVTPKYLTTVSRGVSGKPALEWILEHCANRIAYELKYSDKPMKEISSEMNFPNVSAFGKFVRKRLKTSPRSYRKMNRKSLKGEVPEVFTEL